MSKIKDEIEKEKEFARTEPIKGEPKGYEFNAEKHIHTLDGKPLNGITTVLGVISKPALIPWAVKMAIDYLIENGRKEYMPVPEGEPMLLEGYLVTEEQLAEAKSAHRKKKEEAGQSGTDVHAEAETLLKGLIATNKGILRGDEKSDNPQIQHFIDWAIKEEVRFLDCEKHLYSRNHWIGGITDFVCEKNGEVWVGDIKTSSGIYPEAFLQMGAYALMLEEMGLYKGFKGFIVVNLKKDGTIQTQNSYDVAGNKEAFLSALTLYRALEALK